MTLTRLYPSGRYSNNALTGTYLALNLHYEKKLHIYANYIASMDGRIALRAEDGQRTLPASLGNYRDWRLYQELAAQANAVLVSGRYIRALATGSAQDLLPVSNDAAYADIRLWRTAQKLHNAASVIIFSNSLNLPLHVLQNIQQTRLLFIVTSQAAYSSVATTKTLPSYAKHNIPCIVLGQQQVEGQALRLWLEKQGFHSVYMIAGPRVHHTLLAANVLDSLFLTQRFCLLGGEVADIDTILWGKLNKAAQMQLQHCYLDSIGQQLFMRFSLHS